MSLKVRPARRDDLAAVVAVMNAVDVATLGEPDTTEEDIGSGWDETGFDLEADAVVAENEGDVVAYGELYESGRKGEFEVDVYAHPDAADGFATAVLDAVLERAAVRAGPGARLATWVPAGDARGAVFADAGFAPARQFVRMRHVADGPLAQGAAPDGVVLRAFDREADAATVHEVLREAFAGHVRPMTPSLDRFAEQHLDHPDFDAAFWGVAEVDGRVAGAITAFNHGDIGFIRHVGVLAEYRGRGIGGALVRRALQLLAQAGQLRVDLGVDLEDDVGAARLYEALGFQTTQRLELVERRL